MPTGVDGTRADRPADRPADREITEALIALRQRSPGAMDRLMPLGYDELRRVAHRQLGAEPTGHTLSTTALVHEAYLKVVDQSRTEWQDRLGRTVEAVREARRAMEPASPASQGRRGGATATMGGAVEVFAAIGEIDAALDLLELLFSMPAGREVTVPFLRVWPGFDALRNDPRFEELLVRFAPDQ